MARRYQIMNLRGHQRGESHTLLHQDANKSTRIPLFIIAHDVGTGQEGTGMDTHPAHVKEGQRAQPDIIP